MRKFRPIQSINYYNRCEERPDIPYETEIDELIFFHNTIELEFPPPKPVTVLIKEEFERQDRDNNKSLIVEQRERNDPVNNCDILVGHSSPDPGHDNTIDDPTLDILSGELAFEVIFQ